MHLTALNLQTFYNLQLQSQQNVTKLTISLINLKQTTIKPTITQKHSHTQLLQVRSNCICINAIIDSKIIKYAGSKDIDTF